MLTILTINYKYKKFTKYPRSLHKMEAKKAFPNLLIEVIITLMPCLNKEIIRVTWSTCNTFLVYISPISQWIKFPYKNKRNLVGTLLQGTLEESHPPV